MNLNVQKVLKERLINVQNTVEENDVKSPNVKMGPTGKVGNVKHTVLENAV